MTVEELLKSAGVCCHMPVCHTPCQIKPAERRAGYSHCLLHPQPTRVLQPWTGRKVTACFAGRNALLSCCFPCETLLARCHSVPERVSNHHSDFQRPGFSKMYLL